MELLDFLILSLSLIILPIWWRYWSSTGGRSKNLPPGPRGWPIVGNLIQVILEPRHFIYVVGDLRKKYGSIFTMQMGQRTMIIVTDPKLIHEALVTKGPMFASRPPDSPIRLLFSVGKCAINSAEYGPLWRTLRRNFVTELITPSRVKQYGWIRKWAFENHMNILETEFKKNGVVEVMSNCRFTIASILICLCFGAKISEQKVKQIGKILKEITMVTSPQLPDFLPALTPLFRRQMKEAKKLRERQLQCIIPLIRARREFVESNLESKSESKPESVGEMVSPVGAAYVDSLFTLNINDKGFLSEEECVTLCSEIILAGTDTSATAAEWALLHLIQDQDIQDKLYNEIVTHVGKNGVVQEEDIEKMPFLEAVIKETLRRRPPSHFLLSHAAISDTELGGYNIPAGAYVEMYTAWATEDPDLWSDPDQFRPDRFLSGDGMDVDWTGTRGVKMLPFGAGRRICPAWSLGILHINLLLARMVHAYKWLPVPGAPPDPTDTYAFTVVMKNSLKAVIVPR